ALECFRGEIEEMVPRVRQVIAQTKARIFHGQTRTEGKIFSLFEPSTENIRKGKAGKPNEFGKLVKLQEAENQIIINFEVYDKRPSDTDLLIPAIETHEAVLGRTPRLVAADAGFCSAKNEAAAKAKGVKRVSIPNRSTKSLERKRVQKKRWFRNGQRWRTGCEGRISVVKRPHGLGPRRGREGHEALGRSGCRRRQFDQHGQRPGETGKAGEHVRALRGFARLKAAHELPPAAAGGNFVFSADRPTPKMLILRQKVARG